MLTTNQAAELAHVKPVTIRKWIKQGRLKATHFGREWQIKPSDVLKVKKGKVGRPFKSKTTPTK